MPHKHGLPHPDPAAVGATDDGSCCQAGAPVFCTESIDASQVDAVLAHTSVLEIIEPIEGEAP